MTRVIKREPSPKLEQEIVCRNCGVTLAYTPKDTRQETRYDYTGDSSTYTLLDCPECKHGIVLSIT